MDWLQVLTIAGSTIGSCWFMHREHQKDLRIISEKMNEESKDFHGRLCQLEEKYIQLMQKWWESR